MKKLKLSLQNIEGSQILTREQLKKVIGGSSGSCGDCIPDHGCLVTGCESPKVCLGADDGCGCPKYYCGEGVTSVTCVDGGCPPDHYCASNGFCMPI